VDGSLTVSPDWARDPRMVGVVKSHTTLPFEAESLEVYLTLPIGHRSSAFRPPTRTVAPVHAFGMRLHDWTGHDLLHGLVRIECAAGPVDTAALDLLAGRLLAERAPLAADPRADRMLYGVHDVERWLRAVRCAPRRSARGWPPACGPRRRISSTAGGAPTPGRASGPSTASRRRGGWCSVS